MKKLASIIFLFMALGNMNAQETNSQIWENRLIMIIAESAENSTFKEQLGALKANKNDLEERKIIVYRVTPNQYCTGLEENPSWKQDDMLYKRYQKAKGEFEVILIGLDGSTKMRKEKFTPATEFFEKIDTMPMRKAEMRKDQ